VSSLQPWGCCEILGLAAVGDGEIFECTTDYPEIKKLRDYNSAYFFYILQIVFYILLIIMYK